MENIMQKSYFRWAGSKSRLIGELKEILSPADTFVEPFFGSGVVSFNLHEQYNNIIVSDINSDLMMAHQYVKLTPELLIELLDQYKSDVYDNDSYQNFKNRFNGLYHRDLLRGVFFLILNRTCFNGLCRYNASNQFNVAYGKLENPYYPIDEITECHKIMSKIELNHQHFIRTIDNAPDESVIFCDPPYVPLTTDFKYDKFGFDLNNHYHLVKKAVEATKRGCKVYICNHLTDTTKTMYSGAKELIEVSVNRSISQDASKRGNVKEVIAVYE